MSFIKQTQDTVDILVGWFVDPAQPVKVIRSATRALQILRPFWKEDLSFQKPFCLNFLKIWMRMLRLVRLVSF